MKIREAITQLFNFQDQYVSLDKNVFMLPHKDGVIIAFNANDTLNIIDNDIPNNCLAYNIDLQQCTFEDEMNDGFSYRLAGTIQINKLDLKSIIETNVIPSISNFKKLSGNKPIMLKIAQWGGQGGQGGVGGFGEGIGTGSPMAGAVNFDNPIVRNQFDLSLDLTRKDGESNGWYQSLESRMQENPLYGHKRNDKDWNLNNYRMTYKERRQEKKKEFLKRMFENRANFDKMLDEHSIANIKASPIDPKNYVSLEEKLKKRRHQEDEIKPRVNQHGPESQFTYFPPAPKQVIAQKITHNGLSSIFEDDPESLKGESAYPAYINGRERIKNPPWGMIGPTREKQPLDLNEDNNLMWGGNWNNGPSNNQGGKIGIDYLADGYANNANPGEIPDQIFTPDMLTGVIQEMREHLKIQDKANKPKLNNKIPLEEKLETQHHSTEPVGVTLTNHEVQQKDDGYPYATKNFFEPRYRLNHSGG